MPWLWSSMGKISRVSRDKNKDLSTTGPFFLVIVGEYLKKDKKEKRYLVTRL